MALPALPIEAYPCWFKDDIINTVGDKCYVTIDDAKKKVLTQEGGNFAYLFFADDVQGHGVARRNYPNHTILDFLSNPAKYGVALYRKGDRLVYE